MGDDMVKRLRLKPEDNWGPSRTEMLWERIEAADEIERLRAQLEIADKATQAAIGGARWQSVTNNELNTVGAERDAAIARAQASEAERNDFAKRWGDAESKLADCDAALFETQRERDRLRADNEALRIAYDGVAIDRDGLRARVEAGEEGG